MHTANFLLLSICLTVSLLTDGNAGLSMYCLSSALKYIYNVLNQHRDFWRIVRNFETARALL